MPTYQYECSGCGHEFEVLQSMQQPKLKKCPQCGKNRLARLIGTGGGIIFKGSGFYATDYKKKGSSKSGSEKDKRVTKACSHGQGACGCSR